MDKDMEVALRLHEDPKATQYWKEEEQEDEDQEEDEEEDGEYYEALSWKGKGWLVVLAAFVINMVSAVGSNNLGMLFMPRLLELGSSPGLVTGAINVSLAAGNFMCLPATPLLHRWGCRRLLLLLGCVYSTTFFLAAIAFSMPGLFAATAIVAGSLREVTFVAVQVAVSRCFERRRPLAIGVTAAGTSFNQIMGPPLITFMHSRYSPRTVLLAISVFMLHICIAASLIPSGSDRGALLPADSLAMVRRREVVLMCLVLAISNATVSVFSTTVPLALLSTGYSTHEMVPYLSTPGVANLITRVAIGLLLCHLSRASLVVRLCSALYAAAIPVWFWCERPFWRVAWLCLCSGTSGVIKGMMSLVALEVVGLQEQAEVLSLINLTSGVATLLIGQLTGVHTCVDVPRVLTGSYTSKLCTISALFMLTQVLWEFLERPGQRGVLQPPPVHASSKKVERRRHTPDRNIT